MRKSERLTFRLTPNVLELLNKLSKVMQLSVADVIGQAVILLAESKGVSVDEKTDS